MIRRARAWAIAVALVGATVVASPVPPRADATAAAPADSFQLPLSSWSRSGYGFGDGTPVGACPGIPARHTGFDAVAWAGETVVAAANGTIMEIRHDPEWAAAVIIEHVVPGEGPVTTQYWHVQPRPGYWPGRTVTRGEPIGTVADLGSSTHLHFGVYRADYDITSGYGGLPVRFCNAREAFPARFVDPVAFVRSHEAVGGGGEAVVDVHRDPPANPVGSDPIAPSGRTEVLVTCSDVCHRVVGEVVPDHA